MILRGCALKFLLGFLPFFQHYVFGYRWLDNCVVPWQRSWFTQIRYSFLFPFFSFCIRVSVIHETIITWFHIPDVINFIRLSIIGIGFARAIIIARKLTKGNKFSQRISWNNDRRLDLIISEEKRRKSFFHFEYIERKSRAHGIPFKI